jgi:hypothetical protein
MIVNLEGGGWNPDASNSDGISSGRGKKLCEYNPPASWWLLLAVEENVNQ